ncbi:MAG: phosphoglycerate dehydrogenase [Lachnospiraceae bacterium]|nr:phosphoglycerate dehydrogenase [Lachnospiraceae bacterium]
MYQYHCLNAIARVGLKGFGKEYKETDDIRKAEAVLVRSAKMHDMDLPEKLLCIARAGAGVNNIPLDTCAKKGIVVFNTPGANANAVMEMTIASMLLASRDIIGGVEWVRKNAGDPEIAQLTEKTKKKFAGTEIAGKRLGIIGLGAIGVRVANAARHLGMEVLGYDPYLSIDAAWNLSRDVRHINDISEIYAKCDIITLHIPATDDTKGIIGKDAIAKMKKGVILINLARDVLVNEKDLFQGIGSGKIARYVTDFPTPAVAGHDHCLVIPHLGASTEESEDNCAVMAVLETKNYLENGNINNSVNYPACDMGVCVKPRVAIFHENAPGMLGQFTKAIGDGGHNISDLSNKSRGDVAYTLIDLEKDIEDKLIAKLEKIKGVFRVRVVRKTLNGK